MALGANIISFSSIEKIIEDKSLVHNFVIRTHGITKEQNDTLSRIASENSNVKFTDLTCPSVKRIHDIAREKTSDDTFFILYGNANHDEAIGSISYARGKKVIVSSLEDIKLLNFE